MDSMHQMAIETDDGDDVVFMCREDDCGRRVMLRRRSQELVILETGDFFARHSGATSGMSGSVSFGSASPWGLSAGDPSLN